MISTWSDKSTWNKNFVDAMKVAVGRSPSDKAFFGNWSGANKSSERRIAAKEIYNFLTSPNNPYADKKHATLISHSHGGDVAKVLNNLLSTDDWTVDIINIETPQREDFRVKTLTDGRYLNFYSTEDLIQFMGTSGENTEFGKARTDKKADRNIELKESRGILRWIKNAAGHSLHNDNAASQQIIEETRKEFEKQ
jgi:hypothetical protein